jgi:hypothetical protein
MQKFKLHSSSVLAAILLLAAVMSSCNNEKYPKYSLITIQYVPDSLKAEHRKFITETVRAASQHMTGGDYEDVDETIKQAERTADNVFSVSVIGLEKQIDDNYWNNLKLLPNQFTPYEKRAFDSLINSR